VVAGEFKTHVHKRSVEKVEGDNFQDTNVEASSYREIKEIKQRPCCIQLHYGVIFIDRENETLRCGGDLLDR